MPLMPKPANSATEPLAASALFASSEALPLDDRRQVRVVRGVEERREHGRERGDGQELPQRQRPERERDGDHQQQCCSTQVRPDQDRSPAQAIHPGTGHEPDDERHRKVHAAQDGDLDRSGVQGQDRDERQRDARDERAEDRDARSRPHPDEGVVAPEWGREGIPHERGAYIDVRRPARSRGPCATLRTLGASELAHHRTGHGTRHDSPGPHQHLGALIGPCSTPSASDFERRSAT